MPGIVRAGVSDLDALYDIERRCFKSEAYSKFLLKLLLSDSKTIALKFVFDSGELAGFAIGRIERRLGEKIGRVYTVNVESKHRRRGIGKELMRSLEDEFRRKRCKKVVLEVAVDNTPAVNLYKSLGYAFIGKLKNYYGPGRDAFLAIKSL